MRVYVLMAGEYEQRGIYGVYESLDAALQHQRRCLEYSDIEAHDVEGPPQPSTEVNAVEVTRAELGLKPR